MAPSTCPSHLTRENLSLSGPIRQPTHPIRPEPTYLPAYLLHHPPAHSTPKNSHPLTNTRASTPRYPPHTNHNPTSFFKTLIDQPVTVELKNDIKVTGTLKSVDQYLNIKLDDISVQEELRYPHLSAVKNVFIRGSVVRYVHLPAAAVDVTLLEDAARREAANQAAKVGK